MDNTFTYKARNSKGEIVIGEINDLSDKTLIAKNLRAQGLTPISITLKKNKKSWTDALNFELTAEKVHPNDLHLFCRQMFTMLKSGIPITNGLKRLAESTKNKTLSRALYAMCNDVAGGQNLSSSISQFPHIFPPMLQHIVGVGEQTGRLEESFEQVGDYISLEIETVLRLKRLSVIQQ